MKFTFFNMLCHQHIISYLGCKKTKIMFIYISNIRWGTQKIGLITKNKKYEFHIKANNYSIYISDYKCYRLLHQNHIIHKDIKPQNILCFHNNLFKLADFGISAFYNLEKISDNHICGTPRYIAPEIINQTQYDHRIDFWSFGCVLYELVYLEKIFEADNIYKVAYRIVQ